jgi:hypothetical protein
LLNPTPLPVGIGDGAGGVWITIQHTCNKI